MNPYEEKIYQGFKNELKLYYCGKRIKNRGHSFGPYDRNTYLLYYIKEGSATLISNGCKKEISARGFFVNFPNSQNIYYTNNNSFWSIKWIVVEGTIIENYLSLLDISRDKPFVQLTDSNDIEYLFDEMYENFDKSTLSSKIYCVSLIHKLFSLLSEKLSLLKTENKYIITALDIIGRDFQNPDFNVNTLSKMMGLHYNYFSILFKRETGISPKKAINDCRIKNACKMLKFTDNSVKNISLKCGFSDEFYFSRNFKKVMKVSPTEYRKCEEYLS